MKTTNYTKQADEILNSIGAIVSFEFTGYKQHFDNNDQKRDTYKVTITNKRGKSASFDFGQSISKSGFYQVTNKGCRNMYHKILDKHGRISVSDFKMAKPHIMYSDIKKFELNRKTEPTAYDFIACVTKHSPGSFDDFCDEYGYNSDSTKDRKIYEAVCEEFMKMQNLFGPEELEKLQEIQ